MPTGTNTVALYRVPSRTTTITHTTVTHTTVTHHYHRAKTMIEMRTHVRKLWDFPRGKSGV